MQSSCRTFQAGGRSPARGALPAPLGSAEVYVRAQAAGTYVSHHLPVSWIPHGLLLPTPSAPGEAPHCIMTPNPSAR